MVIVMKKQIRDYIILFLALVLGAFCLIVIVSAIPNSWIEQNINTSFAVTTADYYPVVHPFTYRNALIDTPTEHIMLELCSTDGNNILQNAMIPTYDRYWHGYLVILKPLLIITDTAGICSLNMVIFYGLLIYLLWLIATKIKPVYAFLLFMAMIPAHFYLIPLCMQYIGVFIIALIASVWVMKSDSVDIGKCLFICGCCTSFFDFLTTPLVTLLFPLTLYYLKNQNKYSYKEWTKKLFIYCFIWAVGYLLFWASKWVISSFVLNKNVIYEAVERASMRSGESEYVTNRLVAVAGVFLTYCYKTPILAVALVLEILGVLYQIIKKNKYVWNLLFIQCIPIAWYFILANHSVNHSYMTYRGLIILFFIEAILIKQMLYPFIKKHRFVLQKNPLNK